MAGRTAQVTLANTSHAIRGVPINSGSCFKKRPYKTPGVAKYTTSSRPDANREVVSEYLAHIGKLLAQAKNLRNDNNYEALLIAHEYRHDLGESFASLSSCMDSAALFALRIASVIRSFKVLQILSISLIPMSACGFFPISKSLTWKRGRACQALLE
jgi:hypothetical protein